MPSWDGVRARWSAISRIDTGNLASLVVIITSYILMFSFSSYSLPVGLALVGLGLVYTVIATVVWARLSPDSSPQVWVAYFSVQLILAGTIMFLADGNGWLLPLPLVGHAVTVLSYRYVALVSVVILALEVLPMVVIGNWDGALSVLLSMLAAIVFTIVFTRITVTEQQTRTEVERLASELKQANQKLRLYAAQVEELAVADERNRLAREIHDGLGHYLTAINMQIRAADAILDQDPARAREALNKAQGLASEALGDVRRSVAALRTSPTDSRPLPDVLEMLAAECRSAGIQTSVQVEGTARPLPPQVEFALYRAAQEGLTNVRKHAAANQADLLLDYSHPAQVCLTLVDDGQGAAQPGDGFGLLGLRERVQLLHGQVVIETAPGQGFRLAIQIPVRADEG